MNTEWSRGQDIGDAPAGAAIPHQRRRFIAPMGNLMTHSGFDGGSIMGHIDHVGRPLASALPGAHIDAGNSEEGTFAKTRGRVADDATAVID